MCAARWRNLPLARPPLTLRSRERRSFTLLCCPTDGQSTLLRMARGSCQASSIASASAVDEGASRSAQEETEAARAAALVHCAARAEGARCMAEPADTWWHPSRATADATRSEGNKKKKKKKKRKKMKSEARVSCTQTLAETRQRPSAAAARACRPHRAPGVQGTSTHSRKQKERTE